MGIIWSIHKLRQKDKSQYKDSEEKLLRVVEPTDGSLVTIEINTDNASDQFFVIEHLTSLARFLHATIGICDKTVTLNFATVSDAKSIVNLLT